MSIIIPTVGRVVWFYPEGSQRTDAPLAAIVTCVWSPICVNLAIFDANGNSIHNPPTSILLVQADGYGNPGGGPWCCWMPYQKGQAAKTESLETSLKEAQAK